MPKSAIGYVETARADTDRISGVSVVVPIYNEIDNIVPLHTELTAALSDIGKPYEIILVDDGSTDGSSAALADLTDRDSHVRVVEFRRNFGQTAAMKAGVDHARMDAVVTIDGDLQNDPSDIAAMIVKLEEGYDLVHGWRRDRQDALITRKLPSRIANRLISWSTGFPIHDLGCTLKAIRRDVMVEIELYGEMHRFIPILLHQRGARCIEMVTNHRPRVAGVSKYGIGRTITVLLDLLTVNFLLFNSAHPMRTFGLLGMLSMALSVVSLILLVLMKVIGGVDMTGNPFLILSVMAGLAGIQLLSLGLVGEVLARVYFGQDLRETYAVRRVIERASGVSHGG
ncbi:glycosyltransferase family 2 protein [Rhodophyticola sp.]|jgi:glycosyltransferase involved in cell wall biosynthesis|uniref:glycosyltransferase family 2 protein n=1 Tax=Rhodophyticola sp. TaxID=2680032 RepID=UPI001B044304|nr:glycosyltransferase family 2 protein [Roseicyclus sp.]MBO6921297.1 glycosyltransferase family 2 protein [Roseicyclus sp.]